MNQRIFLSPPHMGGSELAYIQKAFDANYIAPLGENVTGFEEAVKHYTGAKAAMAVVSGTAAIHLALRLLNVGPGDEVWSSSFTFIGSVVPILYQQAEPVFLDSDEKSWNLDPELLEEALETRRKHGGVFPKALIVTHLYGQCADIVRIKTLCDRYGVALIEDAAESLGATVGGFHTGTFGQFGIYSFNGNKIITSSGGGMLIGQHPEMIKKALFYATQARDPAPHYEHSEYGYNYRMSNIVAGIGRGQMEVIATRVEQKRKLFARYRDTLAGCGITWMPELPGTKGNRWLTTCLFENSEMPERVRVALEAENIESRPLWKPMHRQPLFAKARGYTTGVSDDLFAKGLCLPSGTAMTDEEFERVIRALKRAL